MQNARLFQNSKAEHMGQIDLHTYTANIINKPFYFRDSLNRKRIPINLLLVLPCAAAVFSFLMIFPSHILYIGLIHEKFRSNLTVYRKRGLNKRFGLLNT